MSAVFPGVRGSLSGLRARRFGSGRFAAAVVVGWLGLQGWHPGVRADAGVPYRLGRCSSVIRTGCPDCEPERVPLAGGFVVADHPEARGRLASFELRDLVLTFGDIEAHGRGLLLLDGDRASVLAELDMGDGPRVVVGSGRVPGPAMGSLRIDHLIVDGARFDLHAIPVDVLDDDCDGVGDADDLCPATACDAAVEQSGCALEQTCPCATRADGGSWASHRDYVRCVIAASRRLLAGGRLDTRARAEIVKAAAGSLCGRSALASLDARGVRGW